MLSEKIDLLPCPFCGGKAEIWEARPENPKRNAWIACMNKCAVMTKEFEEIDEAVSMWNTRADNEFSGTVTREPVK